MPEWAFRKKKGSFCLGLCFKMKNLFLRDSELHPELVIFSFVITMEQIRLGGRRIQC